MDLQKLLDETMAAASKERAMTSGETMDSQPEEEEDTSEQEDMQQEGSSEAQNVTQPADDELKVADPGTHEEANLSIPERDDDDFDPLETESQPVPSAYNLPGEPEVDGEPDYKADDLEVSNANDPEINVSGTEPEQVSPSYDLELSVPDEPDDNPLSTDRVEPPDFGIAGFVSSEPESAGKRQSVEEEMYASAQEDDDLAARLAEKLGPEFEASRDRAENSMQDYVRGQLLLNDILGRAV